MATYKRRTLADDVDDGASVHNLRRRCAIITPGQRVRQGGTSRCGSGADLVPHRDHDGVVVRNQVGVDRGTAPVGEALKEKLTVEKAYAVKHLPR